MSKVKVNSNKKVVVEFKSGSRTGTVEGMLNWKGPNATFEIYSPEMGGVPRAGLADYADALKKVCIHIGAKINKPARLAGVNVDPDEPVIVPGENCTVRFQIFRKDKTKFLFFTRYDENGEVLARLKALKFTDIPSAVQVAHVSIQAANLMAKYEDA